MIFKKNVKDIPEGLSHGTKFFARVDFVDSFGDFFLRDLSFAIRTNGSFLLGINFCDFQKVPYKSLIILSFSLSSCNGNNILSNNTVRVPYVLPVKQTIFFLLSFEYKHEQTRFLSNAFLCGKFKIENIYSAVNVCGKNVCGNIFLARTYIAKFAEIRTRKYFVPTVSKLCNPNPLHPPKSYPFQNNGIGANFEYPLDSTNQ